MVSFMQILTVFVNIYISRTEKKKNIYIATFLLNLSQLILYFIVGDITTGLIYISITIRSLVYIYKEKLNKNYIPYFFIIVQLLIGILTIKNYSQILSILIPCYTCYYLWFYKDTQKLRIGNIIANTLWGAYNLYNGLYIILIMRGITISSNLIAYFQRRKELKKLQE